LTTLILHGHQLSQFEARQRSLAGIDLVAENPEMPSAQSALLATAQAQ
jgi:hypothetical protein